ncbi:MAG: phage major capsid protein [Desulfarculus sp.]|nr:phage major capsid protein [Desulfarculus sp.]
MSEKITQMREQRAKLIADQRAMLDKAEKEKRDLGTEESSAYDEMQKRQEALGQSIEREAKLQEAERQMAAESDAAREAAREIEKRDGGQASASLRDTPEYRAAFWGVLRSGAIGPDEMRALQAGSGVDGGALIGPETFVAMVIKAMDDMVFIRQQATKFTITNSASLGVPTLDTDPADADWTTELQTGSEDTATKFGKRELTPHPLAKLVKISKELLNVSAIPVESLMVNRVAYKHAVTQEKAFLLGSGAGQPLGLFTASALGIPTSRDVSTGNAATYPTFDGLIEAKYSVKAQYWPKAQWLFHRDALKGLQKLKDGDGAYIWRQSVRDGEPDTLLGRPFMMSEYCPNTFTTGLYVGLFGDFSHYWIVDSMAMTFQRLLELFALTNQIGILTRQQTDGMPVLAEAFARVKLA